METTNFRILATLDGSPEAESVLPAIGPLTRSGWVELTLLRVAPAREGIEVTENYLAKLRAGLEIRGTHVAVETRVGNPAKTILKAVEEGRFEAVAMTTHGRRGIPRLALGSVAEEVLRHSDSPVLLTRPGSRVGYWTRFVVGLDGSRVAEAVLPAAARLARALGAIVHVTYADYPPLRYSGASRPEEGVTPAGPSAYLRRVCDRLAAEGVPAVPTVRPGIAPRAIGAYAEEIDAGLICVGTHARTGLARLWQGSIAEEIVRVSPCPVLAVRAVAAPAAAAG